MKVYLVENSQITEKLELEDSFPYMVDTVVYKDISYKILERKFDINYNILFLYIRKI